MTNELHFETEAETAEPQKEWGLHNGLVVLAALGLVALALLIDWVQSTGVLFGRFVWIDNFVNQLSFVLMLAAGAVIGMLVATRMLQAHVGPRGAKLLALWGVVVLVLSSLLQSGFFLANVQLQEAGLPLVFGFHSVSELLAGTMAIGASMIALAFVGRLRR